MGMLIGGLGVQAAFCGRKNKGGGRRTVKKQPALFNFVETVLSGSLKMGVLESRKLRAYRVLPIHADYACYNFHIPLPILGRICHARLFSRPYSVIMSPERTPCS